MHVLITGAEGFIARNLRQRLGEIGGFEMRMFRRGDDPAALTALVGAVDAVVHLAGVNRPSDTAEFASGNADLTRHLCAALQATADGRRRVVIYSSSTQVERPGPYGDSKRAAEDALLALPQQAGLTVRILRLPNVFGKWARPNYNSVVATFCHNVARDLPIVVHPEARLTLVHVDDVVERIRAILLGDFGSQPIGGIEPAYSVTVGELAALIRGFRRSREELEIPEVGVGLVRALYATYVSYLPASRFSYVVPVHSDPRGMFVEMLKTRSSGQFSFFTARPGVTRGGHYHHSKTEKFLVLRGHARFRFRHVVSGETHELETSGERPEVVDTAPGWSHDITNVGDEDIYVMLWANEIFDRARPDTVPAPLTDSVP